MGTGYNPSIVIDGLVFCVDAANQRSYPKSGTTWSDLAGSNNGTLTNGPTFDAGNGGSIVFDGSNDYITLGDVSSLKLATSFTLECWAKTDGTSNVRSIAGNIDTTSDNCNYRIALTNNNDLAVGQFTSGGAFKSTSITGPSNNTWNHYVLTWDNANLIIYLNTISASTSHSGSTPDTNSTNFYIGRFTSSGGSANDFWDGQQSSVRVYNRALSADEVRSNYEATIGRYS